MINEVRFLKIAYRNIFVSLSSVAVRDFLKTSKSFQQVFIAQLSIYNFLFNLVQENTSLSVSSAVDKNEQASEKLENLEKFCQKTNFSLEESSVVDFLRSFNAITHRQYVMKDLIVRSTDMNDIEDDLNYFSVFVQNSIHVDVEKLTLNASSMGNVILASEEFENENDKTVSFNVRSHEELPSVNELADIGRKSWIDAHTNAKLVREIAENKIYIFTSKPRSVIILKWFALFVLGIAGIVNLFLGIMLLYSFASKEGEGKQELGYLPVFIAPVLGIVTYMFCREIRNIFLSLKGNGVSFLFTRLMTISDGKNDNKPLSNNDNVKFYFDWKVIAVYVFLCVMCCLFTVIKTFLRPDDVVTVVKTIDYCIAVAYIAVYTLIGIIVVVAWVVNPKVDLVKIMNRKDEIYQEISNQMSENDFVK